MTGNVAKVQQKQTIRPILMCLLGFCVLLVSGCTLPQNRTVQNTVNQPPRQIVDSPFVSEQPARSTQPIQPVGYVQEKDVEGDIEAIAEGESNADDTEDDHSNKSTAAVIEALPIPSTEQTTDLDSLVAQALASHPKIVAARQHVAALSYRVPQVTALDDPMFNNTFWPIQDQALQTAGGRVAHQFGLNQKVPWPKKLDARGTIAQREAQVAAAEVAKAEREITEAVRLAYYELWLADQLIAIVKDNEEIVRDLIAVSEARYKSGGSQQDVLLAELEGDKLADQLILLRRQKEQARADLGTLVRHPIHLMPAAYPEINLSEAIPQLELLIAQAEQCNPSLQGLAAEIARDRAKESLACLQNYPDFSLGLGYSIISDDNNVISPVANGRDNINFTLGMTLPIWRDKIDSGIREAAHQRTSTINRREAERDRLRGQLRRQVATAYAATEQLTLFRERLIPRTEQTLEIATADYQGKKTDFTDLVGIYRELLTLQVQVARTKATLASTFAQIDRTVGCGHQLAQQSTMTTLPIHVDELIVCPSTDGDACLR